MPRAKKYTPRENDRGAPRLTVRLDEDVHGYLKSLKSGEIRVLIERLVREHIGRELADTGAE